MKTHLHKQPTGMEGRIGRLAAAHLLIAACGSLKLFANPQGAIVTQGKATITANGSLLNIQTSDRAFINWQSFNIGVGETTTFQQPSSSSVVWNRINDSNPSQILGTLNANGYVILQNQAGFYIGGQASLNTGGLIMTTSPMPPSDLFGGGAWDFSAPPPTASIINYGQINTGSGGSTFLIGMDIENHGNIAAPGGNIGLFGAQEVLVSSRPDGKGLSAQVNLPSGFVDNSGKLIADAGTIAMHAQVVNQGGLVQADSVREVNGSIELIASDSVNLGASSIISAKGDSQGTSAGGSVVIKSDNTYQDSPTSSINISGGASGGNGGQLEISAPQIGALQSQFDAHAASGWAAGTLSLDPVSITLVSGSGFNSTSGTILKGDTTGTDASGKLTLNTDSLASFSQILLQASQDITVSEQWNLNATQDKNATLTLEAGRNIIFNNNDSINAGNFWTVNLYAGADFTKSPGSVISGAGSIDLTGNSTANGKGTGLATVTTLDGAINAIAGGSIFVGKGFLQTSSGLLTATAGQNLTIGTGAIRTIGGGSINASAVGNVNTGTGTIGYANTAVPVGYFLSAATLSGLSTAAGGDVIITAGGDITSLLPSGTSASDAGSGAFGPEPGVVTINAKGNVFGHYVVVDSERLDQNGNLVAVPSTITAGINAGTSGSKLALSLSKGAWQVSAPNGSIALQEVRDSNGTFDTKGSLAHVFDYDSFASVDLNAGVGVELFGGGPRAGTGTKDQVGVIYPPTLTIEAGSGGITIDTPITLYPSANGELHLSTAPGSNGSLVGRGGQTPDLFMSDSSDNTYTSTTSFTGHAQNPIHADDPNDPVTVSIAGDMNNFYLVTPKETQITVAGNINNSYFQGQNLGPKDVTSITVGKEIFDANRDTFYNLNAPLSDSIAAEVESSGFLSSLFDINGNQVFPGGNALNAPQFFYNGGTVVATSGKISAAQYKALVLTDANLNPISLQPLYAQYSIDGVPQFDLVTGKPLLVPPGSTAPPTPITFLDPTIIAGLFNNSQNAPSYTETARPFLGVGGPGKFMITADSMDLGSSGGIQSRGPADNPALLGLGDSGASIGITLAHDLTLFASTIVTYFGGDIDIKAGGAVNIGSSQGLSLLDPNFNPTPSSGFPAPSPGFGIYTAAAGDITISAHGSIDLADSRVATFAGGNITLTSATGDVNAGNGAATDVQVSVFQVNPDTGKIIELDTIFNGNGILAYTLPPTLEGAQNGVDVILHESTTAQPGNITISTPQGSIFSSQGGIVQEPLNGNEAPGPTVTLTAGTHNGSTVIFPGDIDLSGSGVIGGTINLDASRNIIGLVIGRQDTSVNAVQNFSGTLLSGGTASLSAGGVVSGTIIGVAGISVGGGASVDAALLSQNVSVGGAQAGGLATTATASSTSQSAAQESTAQAKEQTGQDTATATDDDEKKRLGKKIMLAKSTGRVTVILPK